MKQLAALKSLLIVAILGAVLAASCVEKKQDGIAEVPVTKVSFDLERGESVRHAEPLPSKTTLQVVWTMSDGTKQKGDLFRAWDFDRDGRFDMLEQLNKQGDVVSWGMDFDGDGTIDRSSEAQPEIMSSSLIGPKKYGVSVAENYKVSPELSADDRGFFGKVLQKSAAAEGQSSSSGSSSEMMAH
jgi:hypothetical protein